MSRPIGSVQRIVPSEDGLTGERVTTVLYACEACGSVVADVELHDELCPAPPLEEPLDVVEQPLIWTVAIDLEGVPDGD